jgi:5,5'-dehydrodivanillate O-demethylase
VNLSYSDLRKTGPNTVAGQYLRQFWHPIYLSRDLLQGQAKPITVMSEKFTLYRGTSGETHLLGPRCSHRGAQLSAGWVEDDRIRCMYHGWVFGGDGRCVERPAERGPADRHSIPSYPTTEYLGLIFGWLGKGAAPSFPRYPWFEGEGLLETNGYVRDTNYFHALDNHSDEVHVIFAHRDSELSRIGLVQVPKIEAEITDYGIKVVARFSNGSTRSNQVLMPNMIMFKTLEKGDNEFAERLVWRVPRDDDSHLNFGFVFRHLNGAAASEFLEKREQARKRVVMLEPADDVARKILAGICTLRDRDVLDRHDQVIIQDSVAQMGQPTSSEEPFEHLGESDRGIILFRNLWREEVSAHAQGQPTREWKVPRELTIEAGV